MTHRGVFVQRGRDDCFDSGLKGRGGDGLSRLSLSSGGDWKVWGMDWAMDGRVKLSKGEEEHDLVKSNLCLEAGEGGYWDTEGSRDDDDDDDTLRFMTGRGNEGMGGWKVDGKRFKGKFLFFCLLSLGNKRQDLLTLFTWCEKHILLTGVFIKQAQ